MCLRLSGTQSYIDSLRKTSRCSDRLGLTDAHYSHLYVLFVSRVSVSYGNLTHPLVIFCHCKISKGQKVERKDGGAVELQNFSLRSGADTHTHTQSAAAV